MNNRLEQEMLLTQRAMLKTIAAVLAELAGVSAEAYPVDVLLEKVVDEVMALREQNAQLMTQQMVGEAG